MEKQKNIFAVYSQGKPSVSPSQCVEKKSSSDEHNNKILIPQHFSIFVDGASRGNPGDAGAGIFVSLNNKVLFKKGFFLGIKTNNQAEYLALALAILLLHDFLKQNNIKVQSVAFFSDSELLVKQMNNSYKIKNPILKQLQTFIAGQLKHINYTFTHVMREKNKIADSLANQGIDKKNIIPSSYQTLLSQHGLLF